MDLHAGGAATEAPALGGDWGEASGANNSICYTYAIQVELSKRLRKFLTAKENEPCLLAFATALVACVQSL
jgi:hypothetical protein